MPALAEPTVTGPVWRGQAFGLELEGPFAIPGLSPAPSAVGADPTSLVKVSAEDVEAASHRRPGARVAERRSPDGRPLMSVDHHPGLGYRLALEGFGSYLVAGDGRRILCAPAVPAPWYWERVLFSTALPLAALLRGLEPLHASAVEVEGRAVAFVGDRGVGKTSVAVRMMLRGAHLVSDDVLFLEPSPEQLTAYPGPGVLCVRDEEMQRLSAVARGRLGRRLGHHGKTYILVERHPRPLPLAALFFLERGASGSEVEIDRLTSVDPRRLLGSTFVSLVGTRDRLARQLDVCSRLAETVPIFRSVSPPGMGPERLAAAVASELHALLGVGAVR